MTFFSGCTLRLVDASDYHPWLFGVFAWLRFLSELLTPGHAETIVDASWLPDLPVSFTAHPRRLLTHLLTACHPVGLVSPVFRRRSPFGAREPHSLLEGSQARRVCYPGCAYTVPSTVSYFLPAAFTLDCCGLSEPSPRPPRALFGAHGSCAAHAPREATPRRRFSSAHPGG